MPNIGPETKGCRYWGYEPEYAEMARQGLNAKYGTAKWNKLLAEKDKAREDLKALRAEVKAAGHKTQDMGLSKDKATEQAKALETLFPAHKWNVFNHDYL